MTSSLSERLVLERSNQKPMQPLTWSPILNDGRIAGVLVKCSNGHIGSLGDHTIKDSGIVNPSLECHEDECDFHEYVLLEDWNR